MQKAGRRGGDSIARLSQNKIIHPYEISSYKLTLMWIFVDLSV